MSFQSIESSQERGAPIDLYEFIYGPAPDQIYRYTNAEFDQDGGYKAIPVQRASVKTNGKFEKTNLQIRVPVNIELSDMFLPYPPPQVVRCRIRQKHLSDPDGQAMVVWTGRIISSGRERNEAVLTCDSTLLSFKRPGLNRNFQPGCPLLLYGSHCRADKSLFKVVVPVDFIDDDGRLRLLAGWNGPFNVGSFIRGTVEWVSDYGHEVRTILKADETGIRAAGYLRGVEPGTELTMYLGCRHNMDDCRNVFDNINNYGGQPWIPYSNPVKQHPYW